MSPLLSWRNLHFNEQFRQLHEVSPPEKSLPYTTRLTLLQTAVHNIPELRMVETMEEFISLSSSTPGPTMGYDNYLTLLQNACIRYDSNLKSRPSPASRAAYQHELSPDQHNNPHPQDSSSSGTTYGGIYMPAKEFYQVHTTNLNRPPNVSIIAPRKPTTVPPPSRSNPRRSPGPIFLPAHIYKLLSDVAIKELQKHNATTRSTPPPKRAVNTHDTDPHPEHPPTDTPTGDPTPPESPTDPDLDNTEPYDEYAYYGRCNTIHSPGQVEWFQNTCDDKSFHVGGKQVITFLDGYSTPLQCRTGLMYMSLLGKPTDTDLNTYPHVLLTGPHEWDPSVLDYTHPTTSGDPTWAPDPSQRGAHDPRIDEFGNFKGRVQHTLTQSPALSHLAQHKHAITTQPVDFEKLRPYFGWVNKNTIQKTFHKTTQWAVASTRYPMRKHFKSRFPSFNIPRRSEEVATDTIFSDTPVIDSGVTMAQIFVGKRTLVTDVYPLKSQKQFVNTLEDNIRFRGAMTKLISDYAKVEISNKVKDILKMYHSSSWNSVPYHQNHNPAEGRYCTLKSWTNTIMNRSGAPADCWLLCMIHASYILNHLSCEALAGNVPLGMLYGVSPDISIILLYTFYQPVFYATHNQSYTSASEERAARWVGFGEHVGDALTHKLLDDDIKKILY